MSHKFILFLAISSIIFASCADNEEVASSFETPETYTFLRNGESSVSFPGQTERIGMATELINAMADFNSTEALLQEMFTKETASGELAQPFQNAELNQSLKNVRSKVADSRDFFFSNTTEASVIKSHFDSWITSQVSEVYANENQHAEPGVAGQIADGAKTRYISAKGLEYDQAVTKSLIGALMVDQIVNNYLSTNVLDDGNNREDNTNGMLAEGTSYTTMEHKWDEAYGYLFGAMGSNVDPLQNPEQDPFLNKYLFRVDADPDFAGIAQEIFDAYKTGRAAIVASDYEARDVQADILRDRIAEVVAIRAVYYLQAGKRALEFGNQGSAFHSLSEGYGFIYSLRFIRQPNSEDPYFSREEVDEMLERLLDGNGFWDVSTATLDNLSETIAAPFSFSVAEAGE